MKTARELAATFYQRGNHAHESLTAAIEARDAELISRAAQAAKDCATKEATGHPCPGCAGTAARITSILGGTNEPK